MAFVGMEWIVVIIAIVLFLFGAKKIPELARSLGKATGEFNRGKRLVEMEILKTERDARFDRVSEPSGKTVPDRVEGPTDLPIHKAATEYGISTEGRSDQELKELLRKRVTGE
ncbi:MAG: twin-arginine translocase TatA/TatE family subunit [Thermoplasmata archaeon]|nr:twin-arginine translocase TatA/TatE family subunit [Thermoplasmata archaeon]